MDMSQAIRSRSTAGPSTWRSCIVSPFQHPSISRACNAPPFPNFGRLQCTDFYRPPYNNILEQIADKPRQLARSAIKRLGLFPPTADVRILNIHLQNLHRAILGRSTTTGTAFDYAPVSFLPLSGLCEEDILDALPAYGVLPETSWLSVTPHNLHNHPHTAKTAFAANGLRSLRQRHGHRSVRGGRARDAGALGLHPRIHGTLSILARLSRLSVAKLEYEPSDADEHTLSSFALGHAACASRPDDDEEAYYWAEVLVFLSELPRRFRDQGPITVVSFLGDWAVMHGQFADVAMMAVQGFQERVPLLAAAAARGALELARRWVVRRGKGWVWVCAQWWWGVCKRDSFSSTRSIKS